MLGPVATFPPDYRIGNDSVDPCFQYCNTTSNARMWALILNDGSGRAVGVSASLGVGYRVVVDGSVRV
jgi:hypothetical protein